VAYIFLLKRDDPPPNNEELLPNKEGLLPKIDGLVLPKILDWLDEVFFGSSLLPPSLLSPSA
jgi:hypothetical protein